MEFLTVPLSQGSASAEYFQGFDPLPENSFRGMATVFNGLIDSYVPTVIQPGAFTKTLQEKGRGVKLLWQHDMSDPIGIPETLVETPTGLALQGKISLTTRGRDALQLMRDGVLDALSIGFDPIKQTTEQAPDGSIVLRKIQEIRLWEISLVTLGADSAARITEVNALGTSEVFGVNAYGDLPLYEREAAWDSSAAEKRVREWAGAEEKPNAKYRKAFVWYDATKPDDFGSYKLGIADITDGALTAVPRAIFAVAAVLQGARGGVNIPAEDKTKAKAHIEKYYAKMRTAFDDDSIVVPWDNSNSLGLYEVEDALFLLGQNLVQGLSLDEAKAAFALVGAAPCTSASGLEDIERMLLDADLTMLERLVEP